MLKSLRVFVPLLPFLVHAQAIVVSADRIPSEKETVSSEVQSISQKELISLRSDLLWTKLSSLPEITVTNSGGQGQTSTLSLRGAEARHSLVIFEDIELNDASTTGNLADLSQLSFGSLGLVEVLPGSQSVLYGSDAIGGVLNLKLPDLSLVKRAHFNYHGSYGSHNSNNIGITHFNKVNKFRYFINTSQMSTDGISQTSVKHNNNSERDEHFLGSVTGKLEYKLNDLHEFSFLSQLTSSSADLDKGFGASRDDNNYETRSRNFLYQLGSKHIFLNGLWEATFKFNSIENKREDVDGVDDLSSTLTTFSSRFSRNKFFNQNNLYLTKRDTITIGLEHEYESGQTQSLNTGTLSGLNKISEENQSLFVLHKRTDKFFWSTGFRVQHFNAKNEATFKIAPGFKFSQGRFWSSFSTGYKNPSLFQRKSSDFGNPNLKPEESKSFELGAESSPKSELQLRVVLYHLSIDNLINTTGTFPNIFYVNLDKATSTGLSVSLDIKYAGFSFTKQNTYDENDKELINRPKSAAMAYVNIPYDKYTFYLDTVYKGKRDSGSAFNRTRLGGTTLLNSKVTFDYKETLTLWLALNNLLNRKYTEVSDFNSEKFNFKIGFNWRY